MKLTKKQKVSITLDEDIIATIKQLSEEVDRSFYQYVNIVLKKHIVEKKEKGSPSDSV